MQIIKLIRNIKRTTRIYRSANWIVIKRMQRDYVKHWQKYRIWYGRQWYYNNSKLQSFPEKAYARDHILRTIKSYVGIHATRSSSSVKLGKNMFRIGKKHRGPQCRSKIYIAKKLRNYITTSIHITSFFYFVDQELMRSTITDVDMPLNWHSFSMTCHCVNSVGVSNIRRVDVTT